MRNTLKHRTLLLATVAMRAVAFDNKAGWKLDADGKLVVDANNNPIYIDGDGREIITEPSTIGRLNSEAATHRKAKETAETKLKLYEGIDPEVARKALETVGKLDAKSLIDAGEVDKVKEQIKGEFTVQLSERDKALEATRSELDNLHIQRVFDSSPFMEQVAIPKDAFQATFARNFKRVEGKIEAYDAHGNRLMSKKAPGDFADPNEALEMLVSARADKDSFIKAPAAGGTGGAGGGGVRGGGRAIRRSEFDTASPADKAAWGQAVAKGEAQLVD